MGLIHFLETHMMTCPVKALTGHDCPGCGMQRSFIMLLKGDLLDSLIMFPGLIPIIITFITLALHLKFKYEKGGIVLMWMYIFSTAVILTSFFIKQALYHHA